MAKLSKELQTGTLHPRETLFIAGTLGSLNAEIICDSDGCATAALDLRGTFSLTVQVQGTVDGINWVLIPIRSQLGGVYVSGATAAGVYMAACAGFDKIRAVVTAYTSGSATATLAASNPLFDDFAKNGGITPLLVTVTAAIGVAATLTLPAPGAGLRQYVTYLSINRFAGALLVAAATPVIVTTTNLPGSLAFSIPADAALQGTLDRWREDFAFPLMASAQNTAVTFVAPLTANVIWRITAGYYVAP